MINPKNVSSLQAGLLNVQERIAYALGKSEHIEHTVFLSVSLSDKVGNVLQTFDSTKTTSSRGVPLPDSNGLFAPGLPLNTQLRRIAAVAEIAAYIFSINNDPAVVINATYQDTPAGSNTTMDYVVQCYLKEGKLVQKEVQVADRS